MAKWPWESIQYVVADKAYSSGRIKKFIRNKNATPVIPLKGVYLPKESKLTVNDFYDVQIYRKRHVIERLFGRMKENKRIATRFDKLDINFLNFVALSILKLHKLLC